MIGQPAVSVGAGKTMRKSALTHMMTTRLTKKRGVEPELTVAIGIFLCLSFGFGKG
jgi:hypothetical protein